MYNSIIADVISAFESGKSNPHGICIGENCPYFYMDSAICRNCDE